MRVSRAVVGSGMQAEPKTLIIRAAPGVRYQEVVTAVDVAKGAGVVAVGLK